MAASKAYIAKSATYKSAAFDGITNISVTQSGQVVPLLTDAETSVEAHFVDGIQAEVSVQCTNLSGAETLLPGDAGTLVVVFQCRAEGRGAAGTGNVTATFAHATVSNITMGSAVTGLGDATISFVCAAPDSGNPVVYS